MKRTTFRRFSLAGVCLVLLAALAALVGATATADAVTLNVTYTYDVQGRLVAVDLGNGTRIFYVYDANGNLLRRLIATPRVQPRLRPLSSAVAPEEPLARAADSSDPARESSPESAPEPEQVVQKTPQMVDAASSQPVEDTSAVPAQPASERRGEQ